MTLQSLIEFVDKVYQNGEEGLVGQYHRDPKGDHGDTLAKFIAIELAETFDKDETDDEQFGEAIVAMSRAANDLRNVVDALEDARCDA